MTWKTTEVITWTVLGIVISSMLALGTYVIVNLPGRCIVSQSMICTGGMIYTHSGGMFKGPVVMYQLDYPGIRERSGESCTCSVNVTEAEYNRRVCRPKGAADEGPL